VKSYDGHTVYKDSVAKTNINKYKKRFPLVRAYLEYKELLKLTNTYGHKFLRNVNPVTGRIHSNFFPLLVTGRMSSSPNLQNIPTKPR